MVNICTSIHTIAIQVLCISNIRNVHGAVLGLRPANERRRYFVTTSLIGWVQA